MEAQERRIVLGVWIVAMLMLRKKRKKMGMKGGELVSAVGGKEEVVKDPEPIEVSDLEAQKLSLPTSHLVDAVP